MGTNIADLPEPIQRQIREQLEADAARRAAQCQSCKGLLTIKVNGKTVRCYECRGKVEGGKVIPAKRTKYGAIRTTYSSVQGFTRTFDSKGEARHAELLDGGIKAGLVSWWLPQVTIPLQGGVKYRADFQVMWADGRLVFQDFKGADTQASINKRKQVAEGFGITVELVRA